jgi:hypothetical protein
MLLGTTLGIFQSSIRNTLISVLNFSSSLYDALFERNSTAIVTDFEELQKQSLTGEARFEGARRVYNYAINTYSTSDFRTIDGVWTIGDGAVNNGKMANEVSTTTANTRLGCLRSGDLNSFVGLEVTGSVWLRADTPIDVIVGTTDFFMRGFATVQKTISVTTEWQRVSTPSDFSVVPSSQDVMFVLRPQGTTPFYVSQKQLEVVNGQSNQNPSEFTLPQWQSEYLNFDGSGYINMGLIPALALTNNFTVSVYAQAVSQPSIAGIVTRQNVGDLGGYNIAKLTNGRFAAYFGTAGYLQMGSGAVNDDGAWRHVILEINSNIARLYIDNVLQVVTKDVTGLLDANDRDFHIGNFYGNRTTSAYTGGIKETRIYNKVLSAEERTQLFNHQTPTDQLVGSWDVNEREGSIVYDSSNNNHGTLINFNLFPKYYGTENGNTVDGNGVVTETVGSNIAESTKKGILIEEQRTNLFLNSNAPATQSVTVTNTTSYTISAIGTGDIVLSGAGSGTVTEGNPITITTTTTSLGCTVNGSLDYAQVEQGDFATSFIITGGASATRIADKLSYEKTDDFNDVKGSIIITATSNRFNANGVYWVVDFGNATGVYQDTDGLLKGTDGTNTIILGASSDDGTLDEIYFEWTPDILKGKLNDTYATPVSFSGDMNSGDTFYIGRKNDNTAFWNGTIKRFDIYNG